MRLELCLQCKRPYLAREEFCPRCPRLEWNQESWANFGCLATTLLPMLVMIFFWLFLFLGFFSGKKKSVLSL